jgi:hypothetical protein
MTVFGWICAVLGAFALGLLTGLDLAGPEPAWWTGFFPGVPIGLAFMDAIRRR